MIGNVVSTYDDVCVMVEHRDVQKFLKLESIHSKCVRHSISAGQHYAFLRDGQRRCRVNELIQPISIKFLTGSLHQNLLVFGYTLPSHHFILCACFLPLLGVYFRISKTWECCYS
jgi:hypothetical protein